MKYERLCHKRFASKTKSTCQKYQPKKPSDFCCGLQGGEVKSIRLDDSICHPSTNNKRLHALHLKDCAVQGCHLARGVQQEWKTAGSTARGTICCRSSIVEVKAEVRGVANCKDSVSSLEPFIQIGSDHPLHLRFDKCTERTKDVG
jgi:hypothetical protein